MLALVKAEAPAVKAVSATDLAAELRGHEELSALYDYWSKARRDRAMPLRRELDIVEMSRWIGHLNMVEIGRRPLRFRYLVYGARVAEILGADLNGKDVAANRPGLDTVFRDGFVQVVRTRRPVYQTCDIETDWRRCRLHRLVLPLALDGTRVERLLVGVFPTNLY